jgi:hypothetical protein
MEFWRRALPVHNDEIVFSVLNRVRLQPQAEIFQLRLCQLGLQLSRCQLLRVRQPESLKNNRGRRWR